MKLMVFVAIFPLITVSNCSTTILSDLASFCKDNGMRYVKIVSRKNKLNIAKHLFQDGIDDSELCLLQDMNGTNCSKKCLYLRITELPLCDTVDEISCAISQVNLMKLTKL